ncbi:uncharacterized protein EV422DRAFT_515254 [Fimicolochytrium jonesii]|uniref:uncharacterized protein n=1 Tax=Fimicolochytrium jonesii TaxID=1396493 RepID=UPI0022FE504F|nr:uncharacterized protein EV422DRAFT_515254 [Fimicolochytrium jonesii]KAI8826085.1 hypothetical protein EV422DRAFT_515254 [Fimicolochytrium jonesii]
MPKDSALPTDANNEAVVAWLESIQKAHGFTKSLAYEWNKSGGDAEVLYSLEQVHLTDLWGLVAGTYIYTLLHPRHATRNHLEAASVHSDLTAGFENEARRIVLRNLWRFFLVGFGDMNDYFNASRPLLPASHVQSHLDAYYAKRLQRTSSGEIDVFMYATKPPTWSAHGGLAAPEDFRPFGVPTWQTSINSLNSAASAPYPVPISPPSSSNDLFGSTPAQQALQASSAYYVVFEATTLKKWIPDKVEQLEIQLASVIFRYHSLKIPKCKGKAMGNWLAQEVLKLVAFAGWALTEAYSPELEREVVRRINAASGYNFPCLWGLLKAGRLLYVRAPHVSERVSSLRDRVEALSSQLEKALLNVEKLAKVGKDKDSKS